MTTSEGRGHEAFYLENGVERDQAIHEPILASINPEADLRHRIQSFYFMVGAGMDPTAAAEVYGIPQGIDLGMGPLSR